MADDLFSRPTQEPARAGGGARAYLLVISGETSSLVPLPPRGGLVVGRAPDCEVQLADVSASRRHSALAVVDGAVTIRDLGSHNGTLVNGERIEAPRALATGDEITVGDTTLVLHLDAPDAPASRPLDLNQLHERLEAEADRSVEFRRPLSVVSLALGGPPVDGTLPSDRGAVTRALAGVLRRIDVAAWDGERHLLLLLPELSGRDTAQQVQRLLSALGSSWPEARAGIACCPDDGVDAATLIGAARAAALRSAAGRTAETTASAAILEIGERRILVADPAMTRLYGLIRRLAPSDLPVLISGETGAGKENAAYAVHAWSKRAAGPFVPINCAAIPENLVESELFGYEKGAFSGAAAAKPGLLETAAGGTVFLDELGELPLAVQAKLLRVLEERSVMRLGATRAREVDLRVVAATHRDLEEEVRAGRFRQDLFFRLGTATVVLLPLRDRPREIALLARSFLEAACDRLGRASLSLSPQVMKLLSRHRWPGNVRELKSAMEFAVAAAADDDVLELDHLPARLTSAAALAEGQAAPVAKAPLPGPFRPLSEELRELEKKRIAEAYAAAGWVQTRGAELIGMPLRTFLVKLKQYGISAPSKK